MLHQINTHSYFCDRMRRNQIPRPLSCIDLFTSYGRTTFRVFIVHLTENKGRMTALVILWFPSKNWNVVEEIRSVSQAEVFTAWPWSASCRPVFKKPIPSINFSKIHIQTLHHFFKNRLFIRFFCQNHKVDALRATKIRDRAAIGLAGAKAPYFSKTWVEIFPNWETAVWWGWSHVF